MVCSRVSNARPCHAVQGPGTSHTLHVVATLDCPAAFPVCYGYLLLSFIDTQSHSSISDAASCGPAGVLPVLDTVEILGLGAKPGRVSMWQGLRERKDSGDYDPKLQHLTWHADTHRAEVTNLQVPLGCPHEVHLAWQVDMGNRSET
jgi:hypothetical protein